MSSVREDQLLGIVTVLLVEDDLRTAELVRCHLEDHGMVVVHVSRVAHAQTESKARVYDVVVLDLMLPDGDGLALCSTIRAASDVPIIILSALGSDWQCIRGLDEGADDYLAKPFSAAQLVARIRAKVRRARRLLGPRSRCIRVGGLKLDPGSLQASLEGEPLRLTAHEFSVLQVLAERAGRVLSRDELLASLHGKPEEAFERSIDVHVSKLRQKLGDDPRQPRLIKTVRGRGYMYAEG